MREIIDYKLYDTQTATVLASYWNGCSPLDFEHVTEELYKTPRGAYFLAGAGGPNSKYAEDIGSGGRCGGEGIIPLSRTEAAYWCEKTRQHPVLESEFSDLIEDA